jgi:uncharacterized membrane protein YvbJ
MFCPNCGKQIPDGSKFCPYCGAILTNEKKFPVREERINNKKGILVSVIVLFVIIVGIFSVAFFYNRSNNASAVANKFISALQNSDYNLLSSIITVNGQKPPIYQIQAFCKWVNDEGGIDDIKNQLDSSLQYTKSGLNLPSPNSYVSISKNKSFFILNSYSISLVPSNAAFSGIDGTVVTLGEGENKTIEDGSANFSSLLPGEYSYSVELQTAVGPLSGSGSVTVEPLKGCNVDLSSKFLNSAFYKIPSGIQANSVSLNGKTVSIKSGNSSSSSYLYVGPFPNGIYNVLLDFPAPWGTAEYIGVTENRTGWSTISITGINNVTYEKLKEIANVIDTYNMNDTLLERKELTYASQALEGLEPGSPIYIDEQRRVERFETGSALSDKYFQMILSSKFVSSDSSEIRVVCAENYALSSPVFVYTVHYNNGTFSLYSCDDFSGSVSDYINSPNSVVIKHNW